MIAKIIVAFLLMIILILLMYGAIIAIKENDNVYVVTCSTAAGMVGLLCGFVLGALII
jgi:membrane protein DedA with SNARE-associated domain